MPEGRLARTRRNYDGIIRCPKCAHACGNTVDYDRGVTISCQYCGYTGRNYDYDWKTTPSIITADDVDAFDPERAARDKRAESKAAADKFFEEFMK